MTTEVLEKRLSEHKAKLEEIKQLIQASDTNKNELITRGLHIEGQIKELEELLKDETK